MITHKKVNGNGVATKRKIRYAVVGLGYIAQSAVLPAFAHANKYSELAALISDDARKLKQLAKRYNVPHTYSYDQYDECLKSGAVDAVYIALPNSMHRDFAVRAARAGMHVLCEKPMAVTEKDCEAMIKAASDNHTKLMIAYRLHFEKANMRAVDIIQSGKLGEARLFNSVFTMQVKAGDIRLDRELGGGVLYDIGIYCINAARYLFRAEPTEVIAFGANNGEARFDEVPEIVSAILHFPEDRVASFTASFGASDIATYRVVGTQGDLLMEQAYEYAEEIKQTLTIKGKVQERSFGLRDQFAPELMHFSHCILNDLEPGPSGREGLADVRIIRALRRSMAGGGKRITLANYQQKIRPSSRQTMSFPAVKKPQLVNTSSPSS